jgi:hypothetical protein
MAHRPNTWRSVAVAALLTAALPTMANEGAPREPGCESGKGIERALGSHGFRVVVSGGYQVREGRPVKVQIWENDNSDWVITEAFLRQRKTCIVRSGVRLHMLY